MKRILIVAIGPDNANLLTLQAAEVLRGAQRILLRTGKHGVAAWLKDNEIAYETLDGLYESADDFDALNEAAAAAVLEAANTATGAFCYAVPDPATDATIACLRRKQVPLEVMAGVTQAAQAQAGALASALPVEAGLLTLAAMDFQPAQIDPSVPLLLTELNSRLLAGETKLKLLDVYAPELKVLFGGKEIMLDELDRQDVYSHLAWVYLPASPMAERSRYTFGDLLAVMQRLRSPEDGCPWDREQTHETLRQYIIEEAYELVEAIDNDEIGRVADELGDVLLQVVFHAQIAKEHGEFDVTDVTTAICNKMITRHVHIFGDVVCETSEDVLKSWEQIKKKEKGLSATSDIMRDVPGHLPALMRASKVQNKAKQVGFDWDTPKEAMAKVHEEANEVMEELQAGLGSDEEFGDLLFAVVNTARLAGVQPELALQQATDKFIRRFAWMEQAITTDGKQLSDMTFAEMDRYWDAVKKIEKGGI